VPVEQLAFGFAYLELEGSQEDLREVIVSETGTRTRVFSAAFAALNERIAGGKVKELIMTSTNRESCFLGLFAFTFELCELTDTKIVLTQCIGMEKVQMKIAENEQWRHDEEEKIREESKDIMGPPETTIGRKLSHIANGGGQERF